MQIIENEDYALFRDLFINFSRNELLDNREEHDHFPFCDYPDDLLEKAFELGLFNLTLPESLGGSGQNMQVFCGLLTILSETDASMASMLLIHALSQEIMQLAGQEELLGSILERQSDDKFPIVAFPAFDNPAEINSSVDARLSDGEYMLSGQVDYLCMGHKATHAIIPATTVDEQGFSWFLIELVGADLSISDPILGLGLNMCPAVDLVLDGVKATLIGSLGGGKLLNGKLIDNMIIGGGAISLGVMKGAFNEALNYSYQRSQGGRLIGQWSEVKNILANMLISVRTAEMSLDRACVAKDRGELDWQTSVRSVAAYIQGTACEVTTNGIQVLGGYGYMKDYGQEKRFRDATHMQSFLGLCGVKRMTCLERHIREIPLEI